MKLLIAGAGGHGRVVADVALSAGRYSEVAFIDDRYPGLVLEEGWPVVGALANLPSYLSSYGHFVSAFGDARLRLEVLERARQLGFACDPVIHSRATISPHARLGAGTVVVAGGIVNTGARLGIGCIVNTGATVDHDCRVGDGVHVCPGAHLAGNVQIGDRSWFGIGAVARQGIKIGADALVGAGAVVVNDISDNARVTGNPARDQGA